MIKSKVSDSQDKVQENPLLSVANIESMCKRDLSSAILMLQVCHDDQDVLSALALVLHGKYMNARHAKEVAQEMDVKP